MFSGTAPNLRVFVFALTQEHYISRNKKVPLDRVYTAVKALEPEGKPLFLPFTTESFDTSRIFSLCVDSLRGFGYADDPQFFRLRRTQAWNTRQLRPNATSNMVALRKNGAARPAN